MNEHFLAQWTALFPADPEVDFESYISSLMPRTAASRQTIRTNLHIVDQLRRMPDLFELARRMRHLDRSRLIAIERGCVAVQEDLLPVVEAALVDYLTPSRESEALPHARAITEFLKRTITPLDPDAAEVSPPPFEEQLSVSHVTGGLSCVEAYFREDEAYEISTILNQVSTEKNCTQAHALLLTLREHTNVKVVFNLFAPATGDGPTSLGGGLTLSRTAAKQWRARCTQERDISAVAAKSTSSYAIPETYRLYVQGRDGGCRFPGCSASPERCDVDHVVAFDDGGPTTPENLQCLCRRCHNLKTDRMAEATISPDGSVTWVMPDGTVTVTKPRGVIPVPPRIPQRESRWAATVKKTREKRIKRRRKSAPQ